MDQSLSLKTSTDAELVALAQAGDRSACQTLADRYRGMVISIVRGRVPDNETDDLVQEIIVRAWEKLSTLKDLQAFPAWLRTLALNTCRYWHRRSHEQCVSLDDGVFEAVHPGPSPLDALLRREQSAALRDALLTLSQPNRQAIIMHLWGHYAYSEIAEQLNIPLTTVEGRIHRAKSQLRRLLGYSEPAKPARAAHKGVFAMDSNERPEFVPQFGHSRCVHQIIVSPDGKKMATIDDIINVVVWDLETGLQEKRITTEERGDFSTICFSPDNRMLAVGGGGKMMIWAARDWTVISTLDVDAKLAAFEADSARLWTASWAPEPEKEDWVRTNLFCWDLNTRQIIKRSENLPGAPRAIDSKQGLFVTVAGNPNYDRETFVNLNQTELIIWNMDSGDEIARLEGLQGLPHAVSFNSDGTSIASSSRDPGSPTDILIWDTKTGQLLHTLRGDHPAIYAITFNPNGSALVSGSMNGQIVCWDLETETIRQQLRNEGWVWSLAFTPDRQSLIATAPSKDVPFFAGGGIAIWDLESGTLSHNFAQRLYHTISAVFSPDGRNIAMGGYYPKVLIWENGRVRAALDEPEDSWTYSVAYSPDGARIITSTNTQQGSKPDYYRARKKAFAHTPGAVMVWDAATGKVIKTLEDHTNLVYQSSFTPDGSLAASASLDGSIIIWNAADWQIVRRLIHPEGRTRGNVAISSPDGSKLASTGFELTEHGSIVSVALTIWSVETGEIVSEWIEEDAKFESPTFSPDGSTIAVGMGYRKPGNLGQAEVRLLDVESGAEKQRLVAPGNMDWPAVLAFSPDGKLLVGGTMHGLVIVWDVATGKVKSTVRAHKGFIGSITFSPDGSTLLTSATDALVKLWNASKLLKMKDARESLTLVPLDKGSEWLAYTPEGYYDCSPGAEKYVMWRLGKELFPAEKFAKEYHRPDLVKKRFG